MRDVSRETMDLLGDYAGLIRKWNARINLIAPSTLDSLFQRHIEDCLQISDHVDPGPGIWADFGSGAGLPGLVMAIVFRSNDLKFRLIESDQRKSTFLRTAIRELGLANCVVISDRIEKTESLNADYISARALAPLPRLMPYLSRHLAEDGQAWLMKGRQWQDEISQASQDWTFSYQAYPSKTDEDSAILRVTGIGNV